MGKELEIGLTFGALVLAVAVLLLYVWLSPKEDIPREYFFQVRAPGIIKKRQLMAKAKNKDVVEI